MLRKTCPHRAKARHVSSLYHNSQLLQSPGRGTSSAKAEEAFSPASTTPSSIASPQGVPRSGLRITGKPRSSKARFRTISHRQSTRARSEKVFCGLHSMCLTAACHPFVFDINIRVQDGSSGRPRKVMKRVLLDTGSDLNLISAPAHADLGTRV